MNDTTKNVEDRFHNPEAKLYSKETLDKAAKKPVIATMKFLPEGTQVHTVKQRGFKFTYEKNYPVLERRDYRIKTVDDTGRELWMKEDYFTNGNINLYHDKELNFSGVVKESELPFVAPDYQAYSKEVPDIRKISFNKKEGDPLREKSVSVMQGDSCVLAGLHNKKHFDGIEIPESCATGLDHPKGYTRRGDVLTPDAVRCEAKNFTDPNVTLKSETTKEELLKNKEYFEKVCAPLNSTKTTKENPLLNDMDKLWEKMGTVFPEYRAINSDGLMDFVKSKLPGRRLEWRCGVLTVDGATTNIKKSDVNDAFDGLKNLTTPKVADKLVGKIIVRKLKKLF